MTSRRARDLGTALRAALALPQPVSTLGSALWLYVTLLAGANDRGLAIRTIGRIARDLSVPESAIERWLARLVQAKLVRILSPAPYLTLRFVAWRAHGSSSTGIAPSDAKEAASAQEDVPVSSSEAAAAIKQSGDGGPGEGEMLFAEVRATVTDGDPSELERLVARYPVLVVRRALRRVRAVPAREIRKTRVALFRFLLAKLSKTADA